MSEAELFIELTNLVDIDPFALIGVSVSADEKRIAKRYRTIAKQLHPDSLANISNQQGITITRAAQIIARIVNPSYQKLKYEKSRQETLSILRFRVIRLARTEKLSPTFAQAKLLAAVDEKSLDVFYEQAVSQIAQQQFTSVELLHACSLEIGQLNLVYLHRKANKVIRQKRAGLISRTAIPTASQTIGSIHPVSAGQIHQGKENGTGENLSKPTSPPAVDYVAKHTERAKTYLKQRSYDYAVQELREALKLSPKNPEIHSILGQAYYKQSLTGMARAHFKQAYRLNPNHRVVRKYVDILGMSTELIKEKAQGGTLPKAEKAPVDSSASTPSDSKSKQDWLGKLLRR